MADMTIYIIDLESVPTRYTCEWKDHVPALLNAEIAKSGKNIKVVNISGGDVHIQASPGAFLNFQATNIYKNTQLSKIAELFTSEVKPGDKFVFTDAWNTGILQLKYMSELLGIPVEIHALWHAGSYDPYDFLGRLIKDKKWTYSTERAIYHAVDFNWFATKFHADMFKTTLFPGTDVTTYSTGWPMEYMPTIAGKFVNCQKENIIIFPHRIAPEKQPEIFRDLATALPEYKFIVCQDSSLSKTEYHTLMSKAKLVWSANLQETLGISPFEGALYGARPLLPDRLSYSEMYPSEYLYPSEWTLPGNYEIYKSNIMQLIKHYMTTDTSADVIDNLAPHLLQVYFSATNLVNELVNG